MLHHLAEMFARRVPTERRLDVLVISGIAAMALLFALALLFVAGSIYGL